MDNYTHIFTGISVLVDRLSFLLNEAKISSMIKDYQESGRLAGFGAPTNSVQLYIANSDIEKATPILEEFKKEIKE